MSDLRYGIRYLRFTQFPGIHDITGSWLLISLPSSKIKRAKMRLELFRIQFEPALVHR